jgi:ATP-binding cassette subfamily C (CFTR/MRP) protein 1
VSLTGCVINPICLLTKVFNISTTQALNWVIRSASDVEQNIVSVERILHYIEVEREAPQEIPETKPEPSWPRTGAIRLENYSMRYRKELEPVLRGITINIVG